MTPTPATLPQTIILLALSRGLQPYMPSITRRCLVTKRWIVTDGTEQRRDGSTRDRYALTSAGQQALATSKYIDEARRKLDAGKDSCTVARGEVRQMDVAGLEQRIRSDHNARLSRAQTLALFARLRELEAGYRDALAHNEMGLGVVEDEHILDKEEADEERDWIADQRAILARGVVLP